MQICVYADFSAEKNSDWIKDKNLELDLAFDNKNITNKKITCVSGCSIEGGRPKENLSQFSRCIELAEKYKCSYVSVHCDKIMIDNDAASLLHFGNRIAEKADIEILVETWGDYADTKRLLRVLNSLGNNDVGILWNTHKTILAGISGEDCVAGLGSRIKFVRLDMEDIRNDKKTVRKMLNCLQENDFEGCISCNTKTAEEFEIFEKLVNPFIEAKKRHLQIDQRASGFYPWRKETLIDETFPDVLDRICEEFPEQVAFHYTEFDYHRTYPQFRNDVMDFAKALVAMGVGKGDHVAIWATNVPQWFITFWACAEIGTVLVTVNTAYKIHEAEYLLEQSDTNTLVMIDGYKDSDYVQIIREICPELNNCKAGELSSMSLPFLKNIVTIESSQQGCYTWAEAVELGRNIDDSVIEKMRRKIHKDDVVNMQYTSGTTGFPKGVMLTHYNVVNNGKAIGDCMDLSTYDKLLIQVPMFHCFGMVLAMTAAITHGTSMYPVTAFSPRKGLACISSQKITACHGVPTMFITMLKHPDFDKTDFSHMRTGIMAGSPCPVKVMENVVNKMNMQEICITYGQTESSPATTMSKTTDSLETRINTVGCALFGVECKIVDTVTGKDLPDNMDGEFCARGYNIMKGYYKMPEATQAAIDKDGWLHSGDIARRLSDGNYVLTGRLKDMIIRGGENIYPKEIEEFLYTNPKIHDVQVIGVPDKNYGEEIMACIILHEGVKSSEEEMKNFVLEHMAKHKVPRYIAFVDSFPMNGAGKIMKYKMREWAVDYLGLEK